MSDEPGNFTVRFSPQAESDAIEIAWEWARHSNTDGMALHAEFHAAAGKLAYLPERHAVQQEVSEQLDMILRRILVRHWHLYYQVLPNSQDGPLVRVAFLRDARWPPLTPLDAERIKSNQLST